MRRRRQQQQQEPQFQIGDRVEYFRRGICYEGVVTKQLGIFRGVGRKYRIEACENNTYPFTFEVAERFLCRPLTSL